MENIHAKLYLGSDFKLKFYIVFRSPHNIDFIGIWHLIVPVPVHCLNTFACIVLYQIN